MNCDQSFACCGRNCTAIGKDGTTTVTPASGAMPAGLSWVIVRCVDQSACIAWCMICLISRLISALPCRQLKHAAIAPPGNHDTEANDSDAEAVDTRLARRRSRAAGASPSGSDSDPTKSLGETQQDPAWQVCLRYHPISRRLTSHVIGVRPGQEAWAAILLKGNRSTRCMVRRLRVTAK